MADSHDNHRHAHDASRKGHGALHAHGGHHHDHAAAAAGNQNRLAAVAALTGVFMIVETAGGLLSGSLALLADAGHMLTDFAALVLAFIALRVAARPADWKWTYGFDRVAILAAFVNGLMLFVIAAVIVYEAVLRLMSPPEILGGLMLVVALAGLAVNILAYFILTGGAGHNLNMRGAALHVMGDLLGSLAAIVAAGVIMATGWTPIDPLLSVLVAVLILRSAAILVRESGHILLEGAPAGIDRRQIARHLVDTVPGLADIHHVHVWSISEDRRMATFHARLVADADPDKVTAAIRSSMLEAFDIDHVTVEIEPARAAGSEACADCA